MTHNDPNIDLVTINAYIKFGEILSICSQDIERKQNSGVNQDQGQLSVGPDLGTICLQRISAVHKRYH